MTAEFAAVLPAVVLVLAVCLSGVQVATAQLRLQDASADASRLLGRGEPSGVAAHRLENEILLRGKLCLFELIKPHEVLVLVDHDRERLGKLSISLDGFLIQRFFSKKLAELFRKEGSRYRP